MTRLEELRRLVCAIQESDDHFAFESAWGNFYRAVTTSDLAALLDVAHAAQVLVGSMPFDVAVYGRSAAYEAYQDAQISLRAALAPLVKETTDD